MHASLKRSSLFSLLELGMLVCTVAACKTPAPTSPPKPTDGLPAAGAIRAVFESALAELNVGRCEGRPYVQEDLREPVKILPHDGTIETELVVAMRERCVPVWNSKTAAWELQTLTLRTYGFPRDPNRPITEADADDPNSPHIAWSAPGPTFVLHPASKPGADDGTRFKMRLYNRMPHDGDPTSCQVNIKCNTKETDSGGKPCNPGVDPKTGQCYVTPTTACGGFPGKIPAQKLGSEVVEPPNCFHGANSTNFHFHGFHVSPQLHQDYVGLELRPPLPPGAKPEDMPSHGAHGEHGVVAYGHFDYALDPLRYTQAPGTHWYHAHKHGSTALHVLNGQVGTSHVRGAFDRALDEWFEAKGGGKLADRLLVVQQIQEQQPGLGGADQTGAVLINGQANPIVRMKRGEVQRWRFVGATMQASAALVIGFPETKDKPEIRQIGMDGVQFSPENYGCQPFLNQPDCQPKPNDSALDETTTLALSPGNRVDVLVRAPDTPGRHCMLLDITTKLDDKVGPKILGALEQRAQAHAKECGIDSGTNLGPMFTVVIEDEKRPMSLPSAAEFPTIAATAPYLADLPAVSDPAHVRNVHYEMVNQGDLPGTQFWIDQTKYDPGCMNETLTLDVTEQWTLWNNSNGIAHPFHIHQNPFQLLSESDRGTYKYPVWRDTIAIPKSTAKTPPEPNSNPRDPKNPWGSATLRYVAKEFTGAFVNHCHILGHEDRGMMHNTQASCPDGAWATTGPVPAGGKCDAQGFCTSDCELGKSIPAGEQCPAPPDQQSNWPEAYGYTPGSTAKSKTKPATKAKAKAKTTSG